MIGELSPGLVLIAGAALIPFFHGHLAIFDYHLTIVRVDKPSFVFALIFHLAAFLAVLYALHETDNLQHVAGFVYAGSGI
jgi:multicomponent Na+:H+ antiporter subunit D